VLLAPPEKWDELRALPGAAVIEDGGLTQVEPGTETVVGLPPAQRAAWPAAVRDLERVA
jgi:peptidyl-tRNA hydrolase